MTLRHLQFQVAATASESSMQNRACDQERSHSVVGSTCLRMRSEARHSGPKPLHTGILAPRCQAPPATSSQFHSFVRIMRPLCDALSGLVFQKCFDFNAGAFWGSLPELCQQRWPVHSRSLVGGTTPQIGDIAAAWSLRALSAFPWTTARSRSLRLHQICRFRLSLSVARTSTNVSLMNSAKKAQPTR